MRILKGLLIVSIVILIVTSLLALILIHWTLSKHSFLFSPKGIDNYLSELGNYKALFTATVATMAAYFGFHRLRAATDANIQKSKQDRFLEWKSVLDIRFIEIEKKDAFMKREFIRIRHNLYERLYPLNFNIGNKSQLTKIFDTTFRDVVGFFELKNNRHIGMGGAYPDNKYSYSFDSFRFLFLGCVDNVYNEIVTDLLELYLSCLPADRLINAEMYKSALMNYKPVA